jgi:hypothetical protein
VPTYLSSHVSVRVCLSTISARRTPTRRILAEHQQKLRELQQAQEEAQEEEALLALQPDEPDSPSSSGAGVAADDNGLNANLSPEVRFRSLEPLLSCTLNFL